MSITGLYTVFGTIARPSSLLLAALFLVLSPLGAVAQDATPAPTTPAPATPVPTPTPTPTAVQPLLWTVAPTRAQLKAEIDALAADITAAEGMSTVATSELRVTRDHLREARSLFTEITGTPTVALAAQVRQALVVGSSELALVLNGAASGRDALKARITAVQADVDEIGRQIQDARRDFMRRSPLTVGRTLAAAEREFEPTARELDLFGPSTPRRRAGAAAHRGERLTLLVHGAVTRSEANLASARTALATARATLTAAPDPLTDAVAKQVASSLNDAARDSWGAAWQRGGRAGSTPRYLLEALIVASEIDRQRGIERTAGALITPAVDPPGTIFPRRRAIAEALAAALLEIERLEGERTALAATTQDSEIRRLLEGVEGALADAREWRWRSRSAFSFPPVSWRGLWEREGEAIAPSYPDYGYGNHLRRARGLLREARFALRQKAVFTVAALQREVDAVAQSIVNRDAFYAAAASELDGLVVAAEEEGDLARARSSLAFSRCALDRGRSRLEEARTELTKAQSAAAGSAEFVRAGRALLSAAGEATRAVNLSISSSLVTLQNRLFAARGISPPAPAAFTAAWIEITTRAGHGKEIEVVAREVRDARVYATTRAQLEGRLLPAAVTARFAAADQHVAAVRRRLPSFRALAATSPLRLAPANSMQRELEEARADVAEALAELDRRVAPNVFALRGRLRDATAALDAAQAQIGRSETHLTTKLALPTGVDFAASLRGLEAEWQVIDLHRFNAYREVRLHNREEQVETHRVHNRVARSRREYLAAARAHLARVSTALTPAPAALTPALLTTVTGDLLGAEADRQALREEILGARQGEDRIRRSIRPNRDAALRRRPTTPEPRPGTPSTSRQTWGTRLEALGDDLVALELAVEAALVARPPALQGAEDEQAAQAASLRAAVGSLALGRQELYFATRNILRMFPRDVPRWPRFVAEGFRDAYRGIRTAMSELDQASAISRMTLETWRDRSDADLRAASAEGVVLNQWLEGKMVPEADDAAIEVLRLVVEHLDLRLGALIKLIEAIDENRELTPAERKQLFDAFVMASAFDVIVVPLARGFRAVEEADRVAASQQTPPGSQPSRTVPSAPTGVAASGGSSAAHVAVSWSLRTGETYSVYRCVTAALASCGTALATGLTTSSYLDVTVPAGQAFSYRVRAHTEKLQSALSAAALGSREAPAPQVATVLLTTTGDGSNGASAVRDVAVDGQGVVYAAAVDTDSVFRIAPDGTVTRILAAAGDGTHSLDGPRAVAATAAGVVFVAGGASDNVFRVAVDGTVKRVLAAAGDGTNALDFPADVALETNGAVLVAGRDSDNVFRIAADGTVTQILSATGDGTNALDGPSAVAAAPDGGVYVAGQATNNVFRIAADGTVKQVASAVGDGTNALSGPTDLAVDAAGNALVVGAQSGAVFRVTPTGTVTLVFKATAGGSPRLQTPRGIAVDGDGQIYVSGHGSDNVVAITPRGRVREVLGATGVGTQRLDGPMGVAADAAGNVYVAGMLNHTAFRVSTRVHKVLASTDAGSFAVRAPVALALAGDGRLYVADRQLSGRLFTVTRSGVLEGSHPLSAAAPSTVSAPLPSALALDASQQFYVAGQSSDNVIAGTIWQPSALRARMASAGNGRHRLLDPTAVLVDAQKAVYVAGGRSDNVMRVTAAGTMSQLIGSGGDGTHRLDRPSALALHSDGTLYVAGRDSDNVFRVTAAGTVTQVLAPAGVGGHALDGPVALVLNAAGDLFVASAENDNVFRVPVTGTATRVVSASGDGTNALDWPVSLAVDAEGELYVAGGDSHNVLRVSPGGAVVQVIGASGDGRTRFQSPVAIAAQGRGAISVATAGRTGTSPIPAGVFRLEPRPALPPAPTPPSTPAPAPTPAPNAGAD